MGGEGKGRFGLEISKLSSYRRREGEKICSEGIGVGVCDWVIEKGLIVVKGVY